MTKKNVLVVGGAAGIGKHFILNSLNLNNHFIITDFNKEAGEHLVNEIFNLGGKATFYFQDIANSDQTKNVVKEIKRKFGKIDILVHSAGITSRRNWDELTYEEWRRVHQVNFTGLFYTLQAVLPLMLEKKEGKIVIIGSGSSITGSGGGAHYASSKGAAVGLMRSIVSEYSDKGININLIAPRVIRTEMLDRLYPDEKSKEALRENIPMKRIGELNDTTNAIKFLINDASSYIQGQVLLLDGGRTYYS